MSGDLGRVASVPGAPPPRRTIHIELPRKLGFLLEPHPYKVIYGGRYGLKSHSCARALLAMGAMKRLRILCAREYQNSIDESVYQLLRALIEEMELGGYYHTPRNEIIGGNGTQFLFEGLAEHTAHSVKSWEGADILWVEEGQAVSKRSWDMVIPTIRKAGSEIWVSFNPDLLDDDTYQRWVMHPPPGTLVVKTGWQDAQAMGWFPERENEKRLHFKRTQPDDYENIWEGVPRTIVAGAIYAKEIGEMAKSGRMRPVPYDPTLPVHTVWDLGWNDAMTIIMVQVPLPGVANIINYYEDSFRRYDECVELLTSLGYRWGEDWLPHDAANKNPQTGKNPKQTLQALGRRKVKIIGGEGKGRKMPDPEHGIGQARMLLPRCYIDNSKLDHPTGYLGAQRLIDCLSRTARNVPKATGEPAEQRRDEYKHGADAFRYLAMIIGQLTNEGMVAPGRRFGRIPGYPIPDEGMGILG